jgi:cobalt/nickel transport system ATP-binding protein
MTAILGGNGAGKSTFLLTLNGIIKPTEGEIIFDKKPFEYSRKALNILRRKVGIVFQDPDNQIFSSSVYKDIGFGLMNMGVTDKEARYKIEKAMEDTQITDLRDKPTHALSFGQKKRVAIAGILAMEPEVIVFDEPTAGLDPMGVSEMLKLFEELKKMQGYSVVISTHDIDIVPLYCDNVYVIKNGENVIKGTPDEIFENAQLLRNANLRLPRIAHLMEILNIKDGIPMSHLPSTIKKARKEIIRIMNKTKQD